ncbi:MAG TPA: DNA cytosine methyltransferase [Puia sp.]|nr:DNA cytosine methyltransferase [Puia sp.]
MQEKKNGKAKNLRAVDFFCSGGGMTAGFRKAGVRVLGGIDIDKDCEETYTKNNPGSIFIHSDIKKLSFLGLKKELKIKTNDDHLIFIGCSPCQYWSNIKTIKAKSEESKNLLCDFERFVKHFRPGHIVVENVPGILNRFEESPLKAFLNFLTEQKYIYCHEVINASHYGVPQTRKRFLLIASRVMKDVKLPIADTKSEIPTVRKFIGDKKKFKPISAGHKDKSQFNHTSAGLTNRNLQRLKATPHNGGTRMAYSFDKEIAIKSHFNTKNFSDSYSRMFWDKPAPTITTRFNSISNGRFGHPEQDRGISLREGATLQTFDLNYIFHGKNQSIISRQIGNAVPPILSFKIAKAILKNVE